MSICLSAWSACLSLWGMSHDNFWTDQPIIVNLTRGHNFVPQTPDQWIVFDSDDPKTKGTGEKCMRGQNFLQIAKIHVEYEIKDNLVYALNAMFLILEI